MRRSTPLAILPPPSGNGWGDNAMPKFSGNLWYLFSELDLMDRFEAAAGAGFKGVEFHFPYQWPAAELAQKLSQHELVQVQINAPPGDWDAGERGLAALPGREGEFRKSVATAIAYAKALNCNRVHFMAGVFSDEVGREQAKGTFLENLNFAATACAEAGICVLIEPLNPIDVPGYMIGDTLAARAVIDAVGHPNLFLQYDLYHAAMNGEDIQAAIQGNLDVIGHMQVAGVPGRNEPDGGDLDYPALFMAIDDIGYDGWVGCEYTPRGGTLEGLGWASPWGIG